MVVEPLPAEVKNWTREDYLRARRENHPKLKEAVTYLGTIRDATARHDTINIESAAQLLTDLLKPLPTDKLANGGPAASGPNATPQAVTAYVGVTALSTAGSGPRAYIPNDLSQLVEAIVIALGNNGTKLARGSLQRILAGTLATDDDKIAAETAIKALVAHPPRQENDAVLLRLLISPEQLRTAEHQGVWPARELRTRAIELIKSAASFELRTRTAESLVAGQAGFDPQDPLPQWLLGNDPLNCGSR